MLLIDDDDELAWMNGRYAECKLHLMGECFLYIIFKGMVEETCRLLNKDLQEQGIQDSEIAFCTYLYKTKSQLKSTPLFLYIRRC